MIRKILPFLLFATCASAQTQRAQWESNMLSYGSTHCAFLQAAPNSYSDPHLAATYYDAERVFQQIATHTGNSQWANCANYARRVYRDTYVMPNNGNVPGYWNFPIGLMNDFLTTGNQTSRTAVVMLSQNAAYARDSTPVAETESFLLSREVSYAIMSYLAAESVGEPRRTRLTTLLNQQLGHFDQWFVSRTGYVKPFMAGLAMEALIRYDTQIGDPRIFPSVKLGADWMWANLWNPTTKAFPYIERVVPGEDPPNPAPDLNNLIAPAYAWLWVKTGDASYKTKFDAIFDGGVLGSYLVNAKQFNQNYRWSFQGVSWRDSTTATPTPTPTPIVTPTATPSPTPTTQPTVTPTPTPVVTPTATPHACLTNPSNSASCRNWLLREILLELKQ